MVDLTFIIKRTHDELNMYYDFYWTYTEIFSLQKFEELTYSNMETWDENFQQAFNMDIELIIAHFLNEMDLIDKKYNLQII